MAQGAVLLILFAFMMCLSCLSSSAVGSGVFYACSDGTMSPGEFDLKKCLNFGVSDVITATGEITGLDASPEPESVTTDELGSLIADRPEDVDDANPDNAYLDFFGAGEKTRISGVPTVTAASSKAECARICFNDEVPMTGEGDDCNGFVSDDAMRCVLYPSVDKISGSSLSGYDRSYVLKRPKDGAATFNTFTLKSFNTAYGPQGGPKEFGNRHNVVCSGGDGALRSFRFNTRGNEVNVLYDCLMGDFGGQSREVSTPHGASGSKHKCNKDRNEFGYLAAGPGNVDCGDSFIHKWKLRQWSQSMAVDYQCTRSETSDSSACQDLETSGSYGRACTAAELASHRVQCPNNMALTRFYFDAGKIKYRCCPKPERDAQSRTRIDAPTVTTPSSCKRNNNNSIVCRNATCSGSTQSACTPTNCCTWG